MAARVDKARMRALLREGRSTAEIASLLGCSLTTVRVERRSMARNECPALMSEEEIVRHWKGLRAKVNGVKLLAELNDVTQNVIVDILRRHGCDARKRRSGREKEAKPKRREENHA